MSIRNYASLAVASACATLIGCGGSGEGLDNNGNPVGAPNGGTILTADFNSIQSNVFTPVCTRCHSGATAPRGLRLDDANSYALLVGVASGEAPGLQRVKPGDPNASYLVQKLEGTAAVGQRMPLGGPYLPQSTIDVIRQWITNGAQKSISAAITDKSALAINSGLRVVTTSPLTNSVVDAPLNQIVVSFNRDLDVTLVNASNVVLEQIDGSTITIPATLTVPESNLQSLLITPTAPLTSGHYQVRLRTSGGGILASVDARVLSAHEGVAGQDITLNFALGE
jgi:hypothetical protein